MTTEITQEIVAVAEEFSMSKYCSHLERDAALLQEIVYLRSQVNDLYEENESLLHERAGDNW